MNTFWLKIAGIVVILVVVIVAIGYFSGEDEPKRPPKTFYDQAEEDKEKFLTKPQPVDEQVQQPNKPAKDETPPKPVQPPVERTRPAEPTQLYFKPLSEIDNIEAERLLNVAVPGRSIGRLPMTGFKLMVDTCRQIITKWPDSWYAYQAKRMLADMPPRFQVRYKVTKEEMDISRFTQPRPGTKPFNIKESR